MTRTTSRAATLIGANFTSFFGLGWWIAAIGTLPPVFGIPLAIVGIVLTIGVIGQARRQLKDLPAPAAQPPNQQRAYVRIVATEFLAIGAVVVICILTGIPHLIPSLVVVVVGLHFIPLARLYNHPSYLAVAGGLTVLGAAVLALVVTETLADDLSLTITGLGAALILWANAGITLFDRSGREIEEAHKMP